MTGEALKPCPFCGGAAEDIRCPGGSFVRCTKCHASSDDTLHAVEAWNRRASPPAPAEVEPVAILPPIEVDPDMPSREYIPLPGGWEVQTKGKGSSYRLLDRKTGERHLILCNDGKFVHDFVTRMAKEVHAATAPLYTAEALSAAVAQARREALEEAAAWHDDQAALHDAQGEACGMGSDGWKRHTVAAADHRRSSAAIRALSDAAPAEEG